MLLRIWGDSPHDELPEPELGKEVMLVSEGTFYWLICSRQPRTSDYDNDIPRLWYLLGSDDSSMALRGLWIHHIEKSYFLFLEHWQWTKVFIH